MAKILAWCVLGIRCVIAFIGVVAAGCLSAFLLCLAYVVLWPIAAEALGFGEGMLMLFVIIPAGFNIGVVLALILWSHVIADKHEEEVSE